MQCSPDMRQHPLEKRCQPPVLLRITPYSKRSSLEKLEKLKNYFKFQYYLYVHLPVFSHASIYMYMHASGDKFYFCILFQTISFLLVALNNMQKLHLLASVFGHLYVYLPQCQCQLLLWNDGFPEVCVLFHISGSILYKISLN